MPYYEYKAVDSEGNEFQDVVEAIGPQEVANNLRGKGLQVNSVRPLKEKGFSLLGWRRDEITAEDLMLFNRHLSSIVNTNLPIVPGLKVLSKDINKDSFKMVIEDIRRDIEQGSSLSKAFSRHPHVFSELYINMIEAGEKSGNLSGILNQLSNYSQAMAELKKKLKEALTYPIFVSIFGILIVIFILTKIVPDISLMFKDIGARPPLLTYVLIRFSDNLKTNLLLIACITLGLVALIRIIIYTMRGTDTGRLLLDKVILKLPLFGMLFWNVALAQFCRTFGTLLSGGVPILQTLDLIRGTSTNQAIALAVQDMKKEVKEGESISTVLHARTIFPQTLVWMTSVGEKRGKLEDAFIQLAEFYDREVDRTARTINRFIEPVIIILLGAVVLCMLFTLFAPFYELLRQLGGG